MVKHNEYIMNQRAHLKRLHERSAVITDDEWNRNMDALKQSLADYSEACRKIADLNARTADQLAELLSPAELAGARGEPK